MAKQKAFIIIVFLFNGINYQEPWQHNMLNRAAGRVHTTPFPSLAEGVVDMSTHDYLDSMQLTRSNSE